MKRYVTLFHILSLFALLSLVYPSISDGREKYTFLREWGTRGSGDGSFKSNSGIAIGSSGNVYVADTDNNRVQKFNLNGQFITKWGTQGNSDGQLILPSGIAVDSSGNVYVVDSGNHRIQTFDSTGKFLLKWGTFGFGNGQFNFSLGGAVTVDQSGNVYVADTGNDRIQKFDSSGKYLTKWGERGYKSAQLDKPYGIATNSSGNVYVADTKNDRIQVFNSNGTSLAEFGKSGSGCGEFNDPYGVAIDSVGRIFVADSGNDRIQKFGTDLKFITKWGKYGHDTGQFSQPYSLAIDSSGYIYVSDTKNDRIQVFELSGNLLPIADFPPISQPIVNEDSEVLILLSGSAPDGDLISFQIKTLPANGLLTGTPPSLTYKPNANFNGDDKFTFTVKDCIDESEPATVIIKINPVNDQPEVIPQTIPIQSTDEDIPLKIKLSGHDVDGDSLTFKVTISTVNGSLSKKEGPLIKETGSLTDGSVEIIYTPKADFNGTDSFIFVVNDGKIDSNPAEVTIKVKPVNDPPITYPQSFSVDEDVPLTIDFMIRLMGSDPDGDPITFSIGKPSKGLLSGQPPKLIYTPNRDFYGVDTFKIKANDGKLDSKEAEITIKVNPINDQPEDITQRPIKPTDEGIPLTIKLSGHDVDGDSLTFKVTISPVNGSLSKKEGPLIKETGSLTDGSIEIIYTPNDNFNGADGFAFVFNDGRLDSKDANISITINPVPDPPTAKSQSLPMNGKPNIDEDTVIDIKLEGSDPDGDPLSYTIVDKPLNGSISGNAPNLKYTPKENYYGTDSLTFKVSDGTFTSNKATISINITSIPDPPEAKPQTVYTKEGKPVDINLIAVDVDTDKDKLIYKIKTRNENITLDSLDRNGSRLKCTPAPNFFGSAKFVFEVYDDTNLVSKTAEVEVIVAFVNDPPTPDSKNVETDEDKTVDITLTGKDIDNDPLTLTFIIVSNPSNGSLEGNPPKLKYTPNSNFNGIDSFTFKVNDGELDSKTVAQVSITVKPVNDPPVAYDQEVRANAIAVSKIHLTGKDDDVDDKISYKIVAQPLHGTLEGIPPDVVYHPDSSFIESDSFTFVTNDTHVDSKPAKVIIKLNHPPVAKPASNGTNQDEPISIFLFGEDNDKDKLSFKITNPKNGTLSNGTALSDTSYQVTYKPNKGFCGTDSFNFTVNDGYIDVHAEIVITINCKPQATPDSKVTNQNTPIKIELKGKDPENAKLTYKIKVEPKNGSLEKNFPEVTYTPKQGYYGNDAFDFVVNDGYIDSDPATINTRVNGKPSAKPIPDTIIVDQDSKITIKLEGSDPDNDQISFKIKINPQNGSLSGITPNLTYTPKQGYYGSDAFEFIVNDTYIDSDSAKIIIKINAKSIAESQSTLTKMNTAVQIELKGKDPDNDKLTFIIKSQPEHGLLKAASAIVNYTPSKDFKGTDSFTFVVSDGRIESEPARVTIKIDNKSPIPNPPKEPILINEGETAKVVLDGFDPDGDPIRFIVTAQPKNGSLSGIPPNLVYKPNPGFSGSDNLTFIVTDGFDDSDPATINIKVNGKSFAKPIPIIVDQDSKIAIKLEGSDPGNDPISFKIKTNPQNGSLSGIAPNVTYTPKQGYYGSDEFEFMVNDAHIDSDPAKVSIKVNGKPHAEPPAQQTITNENTSVVILLKGNDPEGNKLTFNIDNPQNGSLSDRKTLNETSYQVTYTPKNAYYGKDPFKFTVNDSRIDSEPATVDIRVNSIPIAETQFNKTNENTPVSITLKGIDLDSYPTPITYIITEQPKNGSISGKMPELVYKPNIGFKGTDTFKFVAYDGLANSKEAEVSIKINNPPKAESQQIKIKRKDHVKPVDIILIGSDPDPEDKITFRIIDKPKNGLLTELFPKVAYTPSESFKETDIFTFIANDGLADSKIAIVEIKLNTPPVIESQNIRMININSVEITLIGKDPDPEDKITFRIIDKPKNGSLTESFPKVIYIPGKNFVETDIFTFVANDGYDDSETKTIEIKLNHRPIAIPKNLRAIENTSINVLLEGSDQDGDKLTYRNTNPQNGILSGTVPNLIYKPKNGFKGTDSFTFIVNDGYVDSDNAMVTIKINNPPVVDPQSIKTDENIPINLTLTGKDPDDDKITFEIVNLPSHGSLIGTDDRRIYQSNTDWHGVDSFSFVAFDGYERSKPETIIITVNGKPKPKPKPQIIIDEDTESPIFLEGEDPDGDKLAFSIVSYAKNGTLSGTPPNLSYKPNENFYGSDSFSFNVNDGRVNSKDIAEVTIIVKPINDLPNIIDMSSDNSQNSNKSIKYSISDIEKDTLSIICEYKKPDDTDWHSASVIGKIENISPTEYKGMIMWNSRKDIPSAYKLNAEFRITPKDADKGKSKFLTIPVTNLLGDYDDDFNIDFDDLTLFSIAWNDGDVGKKIGPADGEVPNLVPKFADFNAKLNFDDLAVFILMWNWWIKGNKAQPAPPEESQSDMPFIFRRSSDTENSCMYSIEMAENLDINSAQICLSYDPNKVQVLSAYKGDIWDDSGSNMVLLHEIDNQQGVTEIQIARLSKSQRINKALKQSLALLEFDVLSSNNTNIRVDFDLRDAKGGIISRGRSTLILDYDKSPNKTVLLQNYPNPFNPETWIPYLLSKDAFVSVEIYTMEGKLVHTLRLGQKPPGSYLDKSRAIYWDGKNEHGEYVSSGVYFYKLKADSSEMIKKLVIIR